MQIQHEGSQSTLSINKQRSRVTVNQIKQQLTYVLISTEPGRKFENPPVMVISPGEKGLQFQYRKCEGISEETEGFCAVGFANYLKKIKQIIIRRPPVSIGQKVLYISKISASLKPLSKNYFSDQTQKYNFGLATLPPTDITAAEIQQFLENVIQQYGPIKRVDVKRNCLMLFYDQDVEIKQNFIVKGIREDEENGLVLNYWAITSHRTLYTYEPIMLIQFPVKSKIRNYEIHSEWLIMAMDTEVLFMHLYRSTSLFLNLNDIKIQAICAMEADKIILFEYKYHHVYQLFTSKIPVLVGKAKTKKIQPFTVAFKKKTALFGGINYSNMLNEATKQKEIYVVENYTACNMVNKNFLPDKKLQICKKEENTPVKNMKYLAKQDLFLCSCGESVYLFHLETSSLIASVDLSSNIQKLYQIDYPINIVNCLAMVRNEKKLIRISFEQYGQIVGTEVTCMQKFGDCIDFYAEGKQICCTDGDIVITCGPSDKKNVLYSCESQIQKINKVAMKGEFFSFLLRNQNILKAYFLEL